MSRINPVIEAKAQAVFRERISRDVHGVFIRLFKKQLFAD